MAYVPNPILFGQTSPGGVTIMVTDSPGGLAGYILLSISGATATVTLNGDPPTYPVTLKPGDLLTLQRPAGPGITSIHALAPVEGGVTPPASTGLAVITNADGSLSSNDSRITSNPDGSFSAPDELVTVNPDGSYSEV